MGFAKKLNQSYELHDSADMGPDRRALDPKQRAVVRHGHGRTRDPPSPHLGGVD
jgi:hypothetical protein